MDAVVQAPAGDRVEGGDLRVVVLADGGPAVDDQEGVAVRLVGELARGPAPAEAGHGIDAVVEEELLPVGEERGDLGDDPPDPLGVHTGGDTADVGEPGESGKRAATEVQAVELHLAGGMGEGK